MTRLFSKNALRNLAIVSAVSLLAGCTTSTTEVEVPASATKPGVTRTGEVYLLRGLANVFSTGMDGIGSKMKAKGLNVKLSNHTTWKSIANDIIRRSKVRGGVSYPIVIMGHSFGAGASAKMATYLGQNGIEVSYVAAFDPSHTHYVGANISKVSNFYVSGQDGAASHNVILEGPGFRGRLENINVGKDPQYRVNHFNVEKNPKIHTKVINTTYGLTRSLR